MGANVMKENAYLLENVLKRHGKGVACGGEAFVGWYVLIGSGPLFPLGPFNLFGQGIIVSNPA